MSELKTCKDCLQELNINLFYKNKSGKFKAFTRCKKCSAVRNKQYRKDNPERIRAIEIRYLNKDRPERLRKMRQYYNKLRLELFEAYGNKCACCGETNKEFFAIDHIHGGGNLEKRKYGTRPLFRKIKREGFPKDQYQILCHNCNMSLGFYGYCPHKPEYKRLVIYGGKNKPEWTNMQPV